MYLTQGHSPDYIINPSLEEVYYLVKDQLGSILKVVKEDGTILQELTYDEFGVVLSDTASGYQPFGYAGGHYDHDTGLVRFGARDYDASIGRWIEKDPIGFKGRSLNLYSYVHNDPINYIDPSGLIVAQQEYVGDGAGGPDESAGITINMYPDAASGFGHVGGEAGYDASKGNYPDGVAYDEYEKDHSATDDVHIDATPEQVEQFRESLNSNDNNYNLLQNNCSQTINKALCDAGLVCLPSSAARFPKPYFEYLQSQGNK
ncbi:RHS repeat-associated core domain-containing protein [bacterium]|nr:RHS repeat-associated core domain-containing protein [bacterium]